MPRKAVKTEDLTPIIEEMYQLFGMLTGAQHIYQRLNLTPVELPFEVFTKIIRPRRGKRSCRPEQFLVINNRWTEWKDTFLSSEARTGSNFTLPHLS